MPRIIAYFLYSGLFPLLLISCQEQKVDFNADVKPILNQRCISCHGGVKQSGGFSVLFREEALAATESGKFAVVPGDVQNSEMIRRLHETDPELRMPYKEDSLPEEEIRILTRWIEQGAEWGDHWAYTPPQPVRVPRTARAFSGIGSDGEAWARNDLDYFIAEKLAENGLSHAPEAEKGTLLRRVYLDLIGIPPSAEQAAAFLADERPDAWERVVDSLLASPRLGEKWASWWLDLARYADTKGYEADPSRIIWRYRDYVIKSFNADKPFDAFTVEQLAGDMLPDPTDEQMIATAFHRNTMNNNEGGTDDEEFRIAAVIDRVGTTWEVFQGTTMSCVQCHAHPYDPIRHEEYYKTFAYFNNTRDEDVSNEHPLLRTYTPEDEARVDAIRAWVDRHAGAQEARSVHRFLKTQEPKIHTHWFDDFDNGELNGYKWLSFRHRGSARLRQVALDDKTRLLFNYSMNTPGGSFEIRKGHRDGDVLARVSLEATDGVRVTEIPLVPASGVHDLYFIFNNPALASGQSVCTIEWFSFQGDFPGKSHAEQPRVKSEVFDLLNRSVEVTPVMVEGEGDQRRVTRVFERGNWLVPGAPVTPGIPDALRVGDLPDPPDRLAFARWLVSPENPLTARTVVNRIWDQLFGKGIITTLEDFGSQGAAASHPALLDWLALRFMHDHQWSMKKLLRDIVLSATYRQGSAVSPAALKKDPENVWLGRAPRVRLSAEQIRDQALAVSGLLSDKMYGPSVMPYQPPGIWMSVYNGEQWTQSTGEDQYRRGVYTFIKRTSPYPSLMMFDGSSREICVGKRLPTNTPLQALVTLNDPVFVEAARALAQRMMPAGSRDIDGGISQGYAWLTFRDIADEKRKVLRALYDDAVILYEADPESAQAFTKDTQATPADAAMTVVANALLNLDEVITKE